MEYIAPRTMTAVSLSGRSVEFEKGVPKYAPPQMHNELIALGIVPAEPVEEPEAAADDEPQNPADREAALFAAFDKLALRGKRGDFTASGAPHVSVLAKELGWTVDAKERDLAWVKYTQAKAT